MSDLADQLRRALDQVGPVTMDEVEAAVTRRRTRRKWMAASAVAVTAAAAALLIAVLVSGPTTTKVTTQPTGGIQSVPRPGPSSSLTDNPLFTVMHEAEVPGGATGVLYADGALFTWADIGGEASNVVTRIDIGSAQVTATARLAAAGGVFTGNLLWLATYSSGPVLGDVSAPNEVVALNPATLSIVHTVRIPAPAASFNGSGQGAIAAAGGLIWVTGADTLYGIDPSIAAIVRGIPTPSPPPTGGYQAGPGGYQVDIAAPPDGTALWTVESPGGGGYDGLQVRNPSTGAVIRSSTNSVSGVGGADIAPSDTYAWLASPTGNMGGYLRVDDRPGLPRTPIHPGVGGSNAISVALAANRLWIFDPETQRDRCADPTDGAILQNTLVPITDIAPLPNGQIAVVSLPTSGPATIAIAEPSPACA